MLSVLADVRLTIRQLVARPGFALLAVVALALGTGAATAVFTLVDHVLLRPLPFTRGAELVALCEVHPSLNGACVVSPPNARDWARRSRTLAAIGQGRTHAFTMKVDGRAESVRGGLATPELFATLDVKPLHGRLLEDADLGPAGRGAVVSHQYWQTRFGSDPAIVGRTIDLDGQVREIVGVLPAGVQVPHLERVQLWTGLPFDPADEENRRWRGFRTYGRLARGGSVDDAVRELALIQSDLARVHPATNREWGAAAHPLLDTVVGSVRPTLIVFLGAVAMLLLVACVNVASLLIARGVGRERELAVRAAIGASRMRLVRLPAIEAVLLAAAGGALGLLLAAWVTQALIAAMPAGLLPRVEQIAIDGRVVTIGIGLTTLAALVAGILPALRSSSIDPITVLRGTATGRGWRSPLGVRGALVVIEIALAFTIAVGAGLLARNVARLSQWEPGFEHEQLVTFWTFASNGKYKTSAAVSQLFATIEAELRGMAGVADVGMTSNGPLFGGEESGSFARARGSSPEPMTAQWYDMSPGYFRALRLPIVAGRGIAESDTRGAPLVAIVNEAFAARYYPDRNPVGEQLIAGRGDRVLEIVGVVQDVAPFTPGAAARPAVYWPYAQSPRWASFFVVRTSLDATALARAAEARLQAIDPDMVVSNVASMGERVERELATPRFRMLLIGVFAIVALTLALVGVYGVLASATAARMREIGVRMALGASRRRVIGGVLAQGVLLATLGMAIGAAIAAAVSRLSMALIPGVTATDPVTYASIALLVTLCATAASLGPALRAATADPSISLRLQS